MAAKDARIHSIYRYPVKGLSPEPLVRTRLAVGATVPGDRRYAIENGPSGFDPAAPSYRHKSHYLMLMKNERLESFDRSIDVHISRIRAAIEADPKKPRRIITVRGSGYVFAKVQD